MPLSHARQGSTDLPSFLLILGPRSGHSWPSPGFCHWHQVATAKHSPKSSSQQR